MSRKFTNRHKPASILVITIVLLLLITAVLAPTRLVFAATNINVTTTDDIVDAATTDIATLIANPGADGQISLREAVLAANNTPGANAITLPSGIFNLSTGTFELQVGVTPGSDITINGAGPTNTIIHQTVANQRVINLDPSYTGGVNVHISGVTISGGQGNTFGGGGVLGGGPQDNLIIEDVVFDSNTTVGINAGGAINFGAEGNLTVTNSTFINNTAGGVGGAINFLNNASPAYTLTVQNSVFDSNTSGSNLSSGGQGGAINLAGTISTFNISGSTFTNNTATGGSSQGGAIHIDTGQLNFNNNRVFGNHASAGTGLFTNGGAGGPTINATRNWWGCNAGPTQTGCDIVTGISSTSFTPWIVMELSANPSSINSNATSTATVSFLKDSNGAAVPAGLSGAPVTWGSPVLGTLSNQQATIQSNGTAAATFTAGSTGGSGSVSATVDNTTLTANITITQPPIVTTHPASQTICEGAEVTLTAAASGLPVPFIQWQVSTTNGASWTSMIGQTNNSLTIAPLTSQSGFQYRAVFVNTHGTATTDPAIVTVNYAPSITTQPVNQTVSAGGTASFSAAAFGDPNPAAQWQVSTDNGGTWNNISGATSPTLSFTAVPGDNGKQYRVVFTNGCNSDTSNAVTLTVQGQVAPSITTQPVDQTICEGANVTFSAAATGDPAPTVQWQNSTDSGATFANISGATNPTLSFEAAANQNGDQFRAVFSNAVSPVTTNAAALTVSTAPEITTHPTNQTVAVGQSVTFTSAASGSPAPTVQWQVSSDLGDSWQDISGATSTTLTFMAAAGDDGKWYRADYTNNCNIETTNTATLSLSAQATTVTLSQPAAAQYTDPLSLSATVAPTASGTVEFFINAASVGTAPVGASGAATLANVANPRPAGSYSITASFTSSSAQFTGSTASAVNLSITQEDAALVYSGVNTAKVGTNLSLKATAYDSAASGFPGTSAGPSPETTIGDITRMWVAFDIYPADSCGTGSPLTTKYARVADSGPAGDGIGAAEATYTSSSANVYCVAARLVAGSGGGTNLYYTAPTTPTTGIVFYPNSGKLASGGGKINDPAGGSGFFGLMTHLKNNKPQGTFVYAYQGTYKNSNATFYIIGKSISEMTVTGSAYPYTGSVKGKAIILIIKNSNKSVLYMGLNASFTTVVVDSGVLPGPSGDTFALTVLEKNTTFKSISPRPLNSGNVFIHR